MVVGFLFCLKTLISGFVQLFAQLQNETVFVFLNPKDSK